jgi:peroxiredoxin
MRNTVNLLLTACLAVFVALPATGSTGDKGLAELEQRPPAPEFELAEPGGAQVSLSDFRGKPLIVNFWATWCPPCRAEMPSMQRAWEQVRNEGIELIAINVGESEEIIGRFLEQVPVEFPVPMDRDSKVVQAWPVRGLPTTFVVDPRGRLAYKAAGERDWDDEDLLDLVRALKATQ